MSASISLRTRAPLSCCSLTRNACASASTSSRTASSRACSRPARCASASAATSCATARSSAALRASPSRATSCAACMTAARDWEPNAAASPRRRSAHRTFAATAAASARARASSERHSARSAASSPAWRARAACSSAACCSARRCAASALSGAGDDTRCSAGLLELLLCALSTEGSCSAADSVAASASVGAQQRCSHLWDRFDLHRQRLNVCSSHAHPALAGIAAQVRLQVRQLHQRVAELQGRQSQRTSAAGT